MKFINASSGSSTRSSHVGPTTRSRALSVLAAIVVALNLPHNDYLTVYVVLSNKTLTKNKSNDNSTNTNNNNTSARHHVHVVLDNKTVKANQETNNTNNASTAGTSSSLTEESTSSSCFEKRGTKGLWVQDWDYANRTDYKMHDSYTSWHYASKGFHATPEQPFRLATSWKWQDDECPVHEISLQGFCQSCADLAITRMVILGDSMSIEFKFSMIALLGFPLNGQQISFDGMQKPLRISCPAAAPLAPTSKQFFVTLWMFRKSPLEQLVDLRSDTKLWDFVENHPYRTAIIANTGAWMKDIGQYTLAFQSLLDWLDSFPDPSKIIAFFRPTIPGHVNCLPRGNKTELSSYNWTIPVDDAPYLDYQDYLKTTMDILEAPDKNETVYNWFNFEVYNAHSRALLQNRAVITAALPSFNKSNTNHTMNTNHRHHHPLVPIHWLNVFNSTILRRDGHVGFQDCLHYYIPEPIDWWVHFFYSMLVDLAQQS